jgi:hypothetical protein
MNVELVSDGLKLKYVPAEAELAQAYSFGQQIGEKLLEKTK